MLDTTWTYSRKAQEEKGRRYNRSWVPGVLKSMGYLEVANTDRGEKEKEAGMEGEKRQDETQLP